MGLLEWATPPTFVMSLSSYSPLVLYTEFHIISIFTKKGEIQLTSCFSTKWLHHICKYFWRYHVYSWPNITRIYKNVKFVTKPVASSPQLHHSCWRCCQLKDTHNNKDLLKLWKFTTLNQLSNFAQTFTVKSCFASFTDSS